MKQKLKVKLKVKPIWGIERATIESVKQTDGNNKYAIRCEGRCLNIKGKWEFEPMPSNRTNAFKKRCRFNTFREAVIILSQNNK